MMMHAGTFYPDNRGELERFVRESLSAVRDSAAHLPRGLIVPHAGYVYSGRTAAHAYKILQTKGKDVKRVILLAPSHYARFSGVIVNERTFRTPLGSYDSDRAAIEELKRKDIPRTSDEAAETQEHSDEVQIPFLQEVLPKAKLVPLLVGDLTGDDLRRAASGIAEIVDESTVIVASSDFTHYGDRFGYAPRFKTDTRTGIRDLDAGAIEFIVRLDPDGFARYIGETGATICGREPIRLLLAILKAKGEDARGRLLHYTTSGDMTGDFSNSVSYAAIALGGVENKAAVSVEKYLTAKEEKSLLSLARHVLERFVRDGVADYPDAELKRFEVTDAMRRELGIFVTLNAEGRLRGCIGSITGRQPLYRGVIENTMNSAARDPRFSPVTPEELRGMTIEISVMSPLVKVQKLDEIEVGRDGLVLVNGQYSGVFLPQVPVEWNWDKTMYLEQLGRKAGLDAGAYKRKETELYRFTAQVSEEDR